MGARLDSRANVEVTNLSLSGGRLKGYIPCSVGARLDSGEVIKQAYIPHYGGLATLN